MEALAAATAGFPIRERSDRRWEVFVAGAESVTVQTKAEAELLALVPIENAKRMNREKIDLDRIRKIVEVGHNYRYNSHAFRGLKSLLKK
jgi:hypothetical protein